MFKYRIFSSYYYFLEFTVKVEKWAGKKIIYPLIIKLIKLEFKLRNTGIMKDWSAYTESDIIKEFRSKKTKPKKYHYSHVWDEKKQKYI